MARRSFSLELDGGREERIVAIFLSPFLMCVCWGFLVAGEELFRGGPYIGELIYYEVVLSVLALAVLAFLWGLFRPVRLHRTLAVVAERVHITMVIVIHVVFIPPLVAIGATVAFLGMVFRALTGHDLLWESFPEDDEA